MPAWHLPGHVLTPAAHASAPILQGPRPIDGAGHALHRRSGTLLVREDARPRGKPAQLVRRQPAIFEAPAQQRSRHIAQRRVDRQIDQQNSGEDMTIDVARLVNSWEAPSSCAERRRGKPAKPHPFLTCISAGRDVSELRDLPQGFAGMKVPAMKMPMLR